VVQVAVQAASVTMGLIVDEVSEVLNVLADQIEASPSFGAKVDTDFILGMGKVAQKVVMLLDVDKVLASEELVTVQSVKNATEGKG
jgi:purine-binding chemotaxis protein CheW